MNESTAQGRTSSLSFFLPNLGWFAAAVIIVWFIVWAKPHSFRDGQSLGHVDQTVMDKQAFELATGLTDNPTFGTTVSLSVIRVQTGSIIGDTLTFSDQNPFGKPAERKTVVYNTDTKFLKRLILTQDGYKQRVEAAIKAGQSAVSVAPYDEVEALVSDIHPGDRIEVDVADSNVLSSPSFLGQTVAVVQAMNPQL